MEVQKVVVQILHQILINHLIMIKLFKIYLDLNKNKDMI
jgi:hypothetical protein